MGICSDSVIYILLVKVLVLLFHIFFPTKIKKTKPASVSEELCKCASLLSTPLIDGLYFHFFLGHSAVGKQSTNFMVIKDSSRYFYIFC